MSLGRFTGRWPPGFQFIRAFSSGFALALEALLLSGCTASQEQALVITAEQFNAVQPSGVDEDLPTRAAVARGAPAIVVENPQSGSAVVPPISVRIRFVPRDDAAIALNTLKIKYRWFDLTDEAREYMNVTTAGIEGLVDVDLRGEYKLKISVSDDRKRTGRTTLRFHIVD